MNDCLFDPHFVAGSAASVPGRFAHGWPTGEPSPCTIVPAYRPTMNIDLWASIGDNGHGDRCKEQDADTSMWRIYHVSRHKGGMLGDSENLEGAERIVRESDRGRFHVDQFADRPVRNGLSFFLDLSDDSGHTNTNLCRIPTDTPRWSGLNASRSFSLRNRTPEPQIRQESE